jgi:hypothetical protein
MEDCTVGNTRVEFTGTGSRGSNRRIAIRLSAPDGFHGSNVHTLTPRDGGTRLDPTAAI